MKRRHYQPIWVDEADHRMAKLLAMGQGITLKQYFRRKVEEDVGKLPGQLARELFGRKGGGFL